MVPTPFRGYDKSDPVTGAYYFMVTNAQRKCYTRTQVTYCLQLRSIVAAFQGTGILLSG
jgi:hypothetical protein